MVKSISLVIPMFNEIGYLEETVSEVREVISGMVRDFEIIIVDDASTDGSAEAADALARQDARVKVIHHKKNRKLGGSLKTGFHAASKEVVIYTDMDMPFDFRLLKDLVPYIEGADIVNGRRVGMRESLKRYVYSKGYNMLIRAVFGLKVSDVNFSMKIFRKDVLGALQLCSEGSFISAEALVKAQYLGYRIVEVPVAYLCRRWGKAKLSSFRVIAKMICEMVGLFPLLLSYKSKGKNAVAASGA